MKYFRLLFVLVFILSMKTFGQNGQMSGAEYCSQSKIKKNVNVAPNEITADIQHSYNVIHYKLSVNVYNSFISPYTKLFYGSNVVTFVVDSTLNYIMLNADNTSLHIDSVKQAGVSFTQTNNILTVNLDQTYDPGDTVVVMVFYHHNNVTDGAFYTGGGFAYTDCEPEGARKWWPCWDKPSDKATFELTAKTPLNVKLGSNGVLQDSTVNGDTITYHWAMTQNIATYLCVLTSKVNYNLDIIYWHRYTNPNDSIPIRFYYNNGESVASMEQLVPQLATFYSQMWGEHPFDKNGFATLDYQFIWGGMENQTLTSLCPSCWYTSVVDHEFAHQWFGDMITCATWADIWLNEGFASYIEALWTEHTSGYAAYKSQINSDASAYLSSNPGWAISVPDWAITTPPTDVLFNYAITYMKGACVHHLLRYVMGDSAYFNGWYAYANDPNLKYHSAVISDFKDHMSAAYGSDLSWFFDEWIYQPNHPTYANEYWISQPVTGSWEVGFIADQTQTNSSFHKMPIQIKIHFTTGADTTVEVMNDLNNQTFSFSFNRQPANVYFDPDDNIVLKTATLTQIPPQPVELTSFTASTKGVFVVLNWHTATEINNKGFEIQRRRANSVDWENIDFVEGHGTTTEPNSYSYTDNVSSFGNYIYRLQQQDFDGTTSYSNEVKVTAGIAPEEFSLSQNYPNPFNPSTIIKFDVPKESKVTISIYNLLGQLVEVLAQRNYSPGSYQVVFNGERLSSGVYIYELRAGNVVLRNKMILEK
jgi:Peptidase family M1 domain/Peptidase M1 N-terminal domain/Secretion system C-terminal sorting domain